MSRPHKNQNTATTFIGANAFAEQWEAELAKVGTVVFFGVYETATEEKSALGTAVEGLPYPPSMLAACSVRQRLHRCDQ